MNGLHNHNVRVAKRRSKRQHYKGWDSEVRADLGSDGEEVSKEVRQKIINETRAYDKKVVAGQALVTVASVLAVILLVIYFFW